MGPMVLAACCDVPRAPARDAAVCVHVRARERLLAELGSLRPSVCLSRCGDVNGRGLSLCRPTSKCSFTEDHGQSDFKLSERLEPPSSSRLLSPGSRAQCCLFGLNIGLDVEQCIPYVGKPLVKSNHNVHHEHERRS